MNDIAAAIGLAQLEKLDWMNDKRRYWSDQYRDAFKNNPNIHLPALKDYMFPACHNFVIQVDKRDELRAKLMESEITTGVHYYPNHLFDMYKKYYRKLPVSESIWKKLITMPLYPDMLKPDHQRICDIVNDFFA